VRREDVPQSVIDQERGIFKKQVEESGKPANVAEKIAEGKLNKFFEDFCLLEQPYVKDPKTRVGDLVAGLSGLIGEKVEVRRFARFVLGEGIENPAADESGQVAGV
jgi:elongation factor Ts